MPLYSIDRFNKKSFLAVWEIAETEEQLIDSSSVPEDELKDILLSSSPRRRLERLAVRALINVSFDKRQYLGYEENNRPFLKNFPGDISISHAGSFACIYVHENMNTGVDIELLSRNFHAVEARILSPYEIGYLEEGEKQQQLCLVWCAKEAIYKVMNHRGIDFMRHIEIKRFMPRTKGKLSGTFTNFDSGVKTELKLHYKFIEEYALVWVAR
ncbi:MAG: 4'-phosphopantetheinyl transferase superfamily protein [Prevotellaceae bacterium]|jgi:phosphopantetheinyl transferase|nr:4'-phosphopantetheinyl transferase superfamily protein [Prevotellaceae bacterium]